jgi:hypothetical protein
MIIQDNIVAFHGSCGDPHECRLVLSPDQNRQTDEWLVDPMSPKLDIKFATEGFSRGVDGAVDFFSSLYCSLQSSLVAPYTGSFDNQDRPQDKILAAIFSVRSTLRELANPPQRGYVEKPFMLESFHHVIGQSVLNLTPRERGDRVPIDPTKIHLAIDDAVPRSINELFEFFLTRLHIKAIPYLDDDAISGVAFETVE